jgi:hypothetical protein
MKSTRLVALAIWLVGHLSFGMTNDALAGDLLEELHSGRSANWFWRQVGCAIAAGAWNRLRDYALPLMFCAAWSSLYSGWALASRAALDTAMPAKWPESAWPYSALLPLSYGMMPALTFVWTGALVYLLACPGILRELSAQRILWGVLASLNVLLVSTVLLVHHFRQSRVDLRALMRPDFYVVWHFLWISVPLALSLFAALSFTVSRNSRLMQRPRATREKSLGRMLRNVATGSSW